jgi:ATP-dependent DNA helicase DinG
MNELNYIDETFGPGGHLARSVGPAYEVRPGQIALARLVDQALEGDGHALAEGPCGTGKGIAYLVPAIYQAATHGKTIVVATANLALLDQLMEKDLPALEAALPWEFSYRAVKGRSNYWCQEKCDQSETAGDLRGYKDLVDWGKKTKTGDKKELPMVPSHDVWSLVSTTSDDCLGQGCAYFETHCHYELAKREARSAGIIVTNLHVLGAHLALRQQTEMDLILPAFDACIIDEAHELPSVMRDFFGFSVSEKNVERLARTIRGVLKRGDLADNLERAGYHFFGDVASYCRGKGGQRALRLVEASGLADPGPILQALKAIEMVADGLCDDRDDDDEWYNQDEEERRDKKKESKLAERLRDRASIMMGYISEAVGQQDADKRVYWVEFPPNDLRRNHPRIESRPLKVGGILRGELFDSTDSVVLVSATLTTTPGNFTFIRSESGVPRDALELVVPSPFDLEHQALAILPDKLPEARDPDYGRKLVPFVQRVVDDCEGRVLGLFTSYKNLETASDYVVGKHPIFAQERGGGMSRGELVKAFKEDVHSSLFGVDSFWTGIDVTGESLTAVVIDKIPFEHQDDPLIAAMKERDIEAFWPWYTNRAIMRLRQGAGRLIRSQSDVGVIVILDERIKTKKYGLSMAKSLGPMKKSRRLDEIKPFLAEARKRADENRGTFVAAQEAIVMEAKKPEPRSKLRAPKGVF